MRRKKTQFQSVRNSRGSKSFWKFLSMNYRKKINFYMYSLFPKRCCMTAQYSIVPFLLRQPQRSAVKFLLKFVLSLFLFVIFHRNYHYILTLWTFWEIFNRKWINFILTELQSCSNEAKTTNAFQHQECKIWERSENNELLFHSEKRKT